MAKKRRQAAPVPKVDYSSSREVLAHQLENAHRDLADRDAKLASVDAIRGAQADILHAGLLVDVARALLLARQAEIAYQSNPADKPSATRKKFEQPSPGGSTWHARRAVMALRRDLAQAVQVFNEKAHHMWLPPKVDDGVPRLYCLTDGCPWNRIRVRAWKEVRGRKLYAEACTGCQRPLHRVEPDQEGETA